MDHRPPPRSRRRTLRRRCGHGPETGAADTSDPHDESRAWPRRADERARKALRSSHGTPSRDAAASGARLRSLRGYRRARRREGRRRGDLDRRFHPHRRRARGDGRHRRGHADRAGRDRDRVSRARVAYRGSAGGAAVHEAGRARGSARAWRASVGRPCRDRAVAPR